MERFFFGKILWAWEIIGEHPSAFELDVMREYKIKLSEFFELSPRTQIAIVEAITSSIDTQTYADIHDWSFRWSNLEEILAMNTENFVAANTDPKKVGKGFRIPRPYDPKPVEITAEQQAQIDEMLTPIF